MQYVTEFASGFIKLFNTGGAVLVTWMKTIVPVVLLLLVLMNAIIAFVGEEKIQRFAQKAGRNVLMRYMVLPFIAAFMLSNPMAFTLGRFLPEFYKPSYYAAQAQFCHTSNGVFPHINPGELFVWLGIAQGIQALGLNQIDLAIRYMLVGIVMNFVGGWFTDLTTKMVSKQMGITLSKEVELKV